MEIMNIAPTQVTPLYPLEPEGSAPRAENNAGASQQAVAGTNSGGGDTVNISPEVQSMAAPLQPAAAPMSDDALGIQALTTSLNNPFDTTKFSTGKASAQLGNDQVSFDVTARTISWNNVNLNLEGTADASTENIAVQEARRVHFRLQPHSGHDDAI